VHALRGMRGARTFHEQVGFISKNDWRAKYRIVTKTRLEALIEDGGGLSGREHRSFDWFAHGPFNGIVIVGPV
jgi:hypothetical protein